MAINNYTKPPLAGDREDRGGEEDWGEEGDCRDQGDREGKKGRGKLEKMKIAD